MLNTTVGGNISSVVITLLGDTLTDGIRAIGSSSLNITSSTILMRGEATADGSTGIFFENTNSSRITHTSIGEVVNGSGLAIGGHFNRMVNLSVNNSERGIDVQSSTENSFVNIT